MDQHKTVLDEAKSEYEKLKKAVDELRASEVILYFYLNCIITENYFLNFIFLCFRWMLITSYKI